jgi:hypothetical protein
MAEEYEIPRCRIEPGPRHDVTMLVDRQPRVGWHFDPSHPKPFFYPLIGPSGHPLTRMGHPGAAGSHSHHRSVWLAHDDVAGVRFWADTSEARIRQNRWLVYQDRDDGAALAAELSWEAGHDAEPVMTQELIAVLRPLDGGASELELQSTFTPEDDSLTLGQNDFGFLGVRVAKSISEHFGGGRITSSEGRTGEPDNFGKPARWMDYSGPVPGGEVEGITCFDHPYNPNHPARWHVREDGWMGPSFTRSEPFTIKRDRPLTVRYLLHLHGGPHDPEAAGARFERFSGLRPLEVYPTEAPHEHFRLRRRSR